MEEIKIMSWNVNGLRTRYNKGHLDWFLEDEPDILCIQETRAAEEQIPKDLDGYHTFFSSSDLRKGHSGVALFSKIKPRNIERNLGDGKFEEEGRILKADYGDFILFNIYFPSGAGTQEKLQHKFEFYEHFLENMESLNTQNKNVLICGDFNIAHNEIDLENPVRASKKAGFLPEERAFLERLLSYGYVDTFRMFNKEPGKYTWWSNAHNLRAKNVGMRLDHFFVSQCFKENVKSGHILSDIMGSDHCPIDVDIVLDR